MNSIWYSLVWKEWHEHKWKLVSFVATIWGAAIAVLSFDSPRSDIFHLGAALLMICIIPFALFVGFGAAANERSRRTLPFLQSLPAPMWRVATVKLLIGLITLLVPIGLTALFFLVWAFVIKMMGQETGAVRDFGSITSFPVLDMIVFSAPFGASLFVWAAAMGVNRKDEVSAAAVSLVIMTSWSVFLGVLSYFVSTDAHLAPWFEAIAFAVAPAGVMMLGANSAVSQYWALGIAVAFAMHLVIAAWYVGRFGRLSNIEVRSPRAAEREGRAAWLSPPRRSMLSAIVWKQLRESGPIVLVGLAGAASVAAAIIFSNYFAVGTKVFTFAGDIYSKSAMVMGFLVALVLGIGVCYSDMEPSINTFWRTRPVNPNAWFWIKFATGLCVLVLSIYLPNAILAWFGAASLSADMTENPFLLPAMQIAIFAAALAMTCLIRQAVYAVILSVPLLYCGTVLVWAALRAAGFVGWVHDSPSNPWLLSESQIAGGFLTSFIISTFVAWLAMRNDWGWKSRS